MPSKAPQILTGTSYVKGDVKATLIAANLELSFWGGVDPKTGEVIDRFHPLSGQFLKDNVLAIPGSRGSCGGSVVIMELILNGLGPKAMIFERREELLTFGVIVTEEFFNQTVPVLVLGSENFAQILGWNKETVYIRDNRVSNAALDSSAPSNEDRNQVSNADLEKTRIQLSDRDRDMLDGKQGEAARISMKTIVRMADLMKADELMDVTQAHADPAWYGPGSVAFGERLRDWGGRFCVPTTVNSLNIDRKRWQSLGVDLEFGRTCEALTKAFVDMGGQETFTCAPYLLDTAPRLGDPIAWGESNAVVYANSVLGARTLKNPNMLECLIAITGRAPRAGTYIDQNRLASIWISLLPPPAIDDSFWPILGYSLGDVAKDRIPLITGLEHLTPSKDDFKAFSAAFATASSAPMFHMVKLTPEASSIEAVCHDGVVPPKVDMHWKELEACWDEFNHGSSPRKVDLVSLGNPHFSFREIRALAGLCAGRKKQEDVAIIVTCGRSQYGLALQAGYVGQLESFGVQFLTDTCWCSIEEPIIPVPVKVIMTNSGKYIHYGPGLTGRQFCFGSLEMCVDAACSGMSTGRPPAWLEANETE